MKIYIVADQTPCFDCSNPEIIAIYNSYELAFTRAAQEINREGTYRVGVDIVIYEMPMNSDFDTASELETIDVNTAKGE